MTTLQRLGGFASPHLAFAYLGGIDLFPVVLGFPGMTSPARRVALLVIVAASRASGSSRVLIVLDGLVGAVGVISLVPGPTDLTGAFGATPMV